MKGIAFGEDPVNKNSFGMQRCALLAALIDEAGRQGLTVTDPRFKFDEYFNRNCEKFDVDPQNPAFNWSSSSESFTEIRRRQSTTPLLHIAQSGLKQFFRQFFQKDV